MTVTAANLGFFGPFMRAWADATPETHAELYTEALQYEAHALTPQQYLAEVAAALNLPNPTVTP